MKVYAGVLGCFLAAGSAIAGSVETATVPAHRWIDVENPMDGDDHCSIDYGDKVSLAARDGDVVILRVETGGGGARCWRGAMFFTSYDDFSTMTQEYDAIKKTKEDRAALVDRMLKGAR